MRANVSHPLLTVLTDRPFISDPQQPHSVLRYARVHSAACTLAPLTNEPCFLCVNCKCIHKRIQDSWKHIFIIQGTVVHSLVNSNGTLTLTQSVHTYQIDSWASVHCSGHFLNTTLSMMRYRAGTSHCTLIYKRPSRSTPACCVVHLQPFNFERRGELERGGCVKRTAWKFTDKFELGRKSD